MPPWNTVSAKRAKTMKRRFPTNRVNGFTIRRRVGSCSILWAFTGGVRQAHGRWFAILQRNSNTCCASLGRLTGNFTPSEIRKNHDGGAECPIEGQRRSRYSKGL